MGVNLFNDGIVKRAVLNDYDGLFNLYPEYLDYKDWIVEKCLERGMKQWSHKRHPVTDKETDYYIDDDGNTVWGKGRLSQEDSEFLQSLVLQIPKKYWTLLATGRNFTHSAVGAHREIRISDFAYFARYIWTDRQRAYLDAVNQCELASLDYRDFLKTYQKEFTSKSILIADPPYCSAYQGQYKDQFTETQTIELLKSLVDRKVDFIFFNHDMKQVKSWFKTLGITPEILEYTGNAQNSANHKRLDVMAYVRSTK